jgi:hypothetical protein
MAWSLTVLLHRSGFAVLASTILQTLGWCRFQFFQPFWDCDQSQGNPFLAKTAADSCTFVSSRCQGYQALTGIRSSLSHLPDLGLQQAFRLVNQQVCLNRANFVAERQACCLGSLAELEAEPKLVAGSIGSVVRRSELDIAASEKVEAVGPTAVSPKVAGPTVVGQEVAGPTVVGQEVASPIMANQVVAVEAFARYFVDQPVLALDLRDQVVAQLGFVDQVVVGP